MKAFKTSVGAPLLIAGLGVFLSACDAGFILAVFKFDDGMVPSFAPELNPTTVAWTEERIDPHLPGKQLNARTSTPFALGPFPLDQIPFGTNRVVVAEVHVGNEIAIHASSDLFENHRGDNFTVPVLVPPTIPPQGLPPELGASLVIISSTIAPGYVNHPVVDLLLFAEERAMSVRLSNVVGLPEGKSIVIELSKLQPIDGAPAGYRGYRYKEWNLNRDVEPCLGDLNRCRREVFAVFIDRQLYGGRPTFASVILDQLVPSLIDDLTEISPRVLREDGHLVVSVTASEVILPPVLSIAQRIDFPLQLVSPTDGVPSATYVFTSSRTAGSIGRDGTFLIRADLRDVAGNRARNVDVGQFRVDRKPIAISGLTATPGHVGAGHVVAASFTYDEEPADGGSVDVFFLGEPMILRSRTGEAPSIAAEYTYVVTGLEAELAANPELPVSAIVEAIDAAGNFTRAISEPVLVDIRPPNILPDSVSVEIVASPDNLLYRIPGPLPVIDQATFGSTAYVHFVLHELTAAEQIVTSTPDTLSFQMIDRAGASYTYAHTLQPGAYAQGLHQVEVIATDDVGNVARHLLPVGFDVDTAAPSAPDTLLITHERVPWGSDATGDGASASVEAEAGAVEASSTVAVLAQPSLADFYLLGSTRADALGGISRFTLDRTEDYPEVYVVAIDAAGNGSESTSGLPGTASRVRRGAWTASFRGKVPGSDTPNPHDAIALHSIDRTLAQDPDMMSTLGPAEFAQLAASDGQAFEVSTIRRWEEILIPLDQPTARERGAMAYDVVRARGVLFGGFGVAQNGNAPLRDTWEWDGRRWYSLTPPGSVPPERSGHAMAYDALRAKTVMFGGEGTSLPPLGDTWTFDGANWALVSTSGPSGRRGHSMVYDWVSGRTLLFGGDDGMGVRNDLWSWDGSTWSVLEDCASATCPPERSWASMMFDGSRVVIRGGVILPTGPGGPPSSSSPLPDAWAWENGVWTQLSDPPAERYGAVHVADTVASGDLFFGGADAAGRYDQTWFNGSEQTSPFIDRPPARAFAASTFDLRRGQVIVFGGRDTSGGLLGDTWAFTGNSAFLGWRDVTPSGETPSARANHAMAYDSARREVLMFGGRDLNSDRLGDTWSWNGSRWTRMPGTSIVRDGHAMAIDGDQCVSLFGGFDGTNRLDEMELWFYQGWFSPNTSVCGSASSPLPSRRQVLAMASTGLTTILFGGLGDPLVPGGQPRVLGDTWERSGIVNRQWTERSPSRMPAARHSHAMAARGSHVALFGGAIDAGVTLDDGSVWEWDPSVAQWSQHQPSGSWPHVRYEHAMAEDSHRGRVLLFGGRNEDPLSPPQGIFGDTWEWDGVSWRQLVTRGSPTARFSHALAYDHDRDRIVLFGGADAATTVWELHADPDQRAGILLSFDSSEIGVDPSILRALTTRALVGGEGFNGSLPVAGMVFGAEMALWNARWGRWDFWSSNLSASTAPGPLSRALSATADLRAVFSDDDRVRILLRPRAGIGGGPGSAHVSTEVIELRVTYEFPN